jgi:hypothetical protein
MRVTSERLRKWVMRTVAAFWTVFFLAVIIPLVTIIAQKHWDLDQQADSVWAMASAMIGWISTPLGVGALAGVMSGATCFAAGVWLDAFLRKREAVQPTKVDDQPQVRVADTVISPRPMSEEAPRFREELGRPIENEWWASLYRVANEARAQNNTTPYGLSLRELSLHDQTAAYAGKINEYAQLHGTPPGPQLSEPIMARRDQIKFRINGMQMDSVDSRNRGFYRYIHLRSVQVQEVLAAVRRMAADISLFAEPVIPLETPSDDRRELIRQARQLVQDGVRRGWGDTEFRQGLGANAIFYTLRPRLSPEFMSYFGKPRTISPFGPDGLTIIPHMLLDELDRLEKEWTGGAECGCDVNLDENEFLVVGERLEPPE